MAPQRTAVLRLLRAGRRLSERFSNLLEAAGRMAEMPDEEPPEGIKDITPMEMEILEHIAGEKEEKYDAIAKDMHLHRRTFYKHLNSLFKKLGVRTGRGAVRVGVKWGLV